MNERRRARGQRGMVLITSLLLLIVVTILALGMFRSFGLDEKIAGNVRDKALALHSAESAEQYAEWWLQSGNAPSATSCTAVVASNPGQVCSNPLTIPTNLPWAAGVTYTQNNLNLTNGTTSSNQASPIFYIYDMGQPVPGTGLTGELYKIDAVGFGGSANTTAIVESTYLVQSGGGTQSAGGP